MPKRAWGQAFENAARGWVDIMCSKHGGGEVVATADDLSRVIRAAVRATHAGRQQGPNMARLMAAAEKAATRALQAATKRAVG